MEHAPERNPSVAAYLVTWAALLGLTGLTWGLAQLNLGAANTPLALLIACGKGLLIAVIFMHLLRPDFVHRLILAVSVVFVVLLIGVVLIEARTRFPLATPPQSTRFNEPLDGQLD